MACCTKFGRLDRPKAAQYTVIIQINSPWNDHLSSGANQRFY
ncbi:hypothetical protein C4J83_5938 [Pseudomonas sp. LBUM920]|nr:hypothetical protein C4J83_5938 [Pseudomonas sp. LBUM920]